MKKVSLIILTILLAAPFVAAQSFEEGLELYESEQYRDALEIFRQLDDERAYLFAGKSLLAEGEYHQAIAMFRESAKSDRPTVRDESVYSMAMAQFRLKKYDHALSNLKEIIDRENRTGLRNNAQRLYRQIIGYLSVNERFDVIQRSDNPSLRYDVVSQSRSLTDAGTYRALVNELVRMEPDSVLQAELLEALDEEMELRPFFNRFPNAPQGTVYHIGVVLPTFDEDDPDFTIPRNLYQGMLQAADEFNSLNAEKKVQLIFKNSAENADTTAAAFTELVWGRKADAVIGPLFSEPATRMAELAEEYRVPMFAPLANSDELNLDYNYTYQLNPTFAVHGKMMARFAVEELGLDSLAVITEEGAIGRSAAVSFRQEAERLGAYVSYFIEGDFARRGYDLSEFTEVFTSDKEIADSLGYRPTQGLYAPFTGQAASTLTNLLMNDLEAMRSDLVVMGSEEWADFSPSAFQRRIFEIYHTEAFGRSADSEELELFEEDYHTRFGSDPDQFSRLGYDTATFIFNNLETAGNPVYLNRALRRASAHDGLGLRIDFDGRRVNQHVHIRAITPNATERLEEINQNR
ncbi:MAG: ABC transporter substrate-binding protein [Balneolaceae bacterium]|nr:ABC transporter substrate-binding protein [Balneolaceae bacterium]MCH8548351.1 ABC transporter substrate-binding protein [Balneolaceae bacterium]